ncbi:transporter substrate-binding domain-containing protein [Virgibacillus halodenitrificans]|uniref:transporter substrate-binding domain-containing protein n=1 Tax=Virgibacillus halodenitrificans TaxID=1482 RepID=UPI0024C09BDB|nr:transporter substrate-binding domain-containing protein [Virgibacillus halodenitrificans]WHX26596.1 transporter substrate-binding domain-containing protein [Virgibacillus halodenitrificans]
MINKNWRLISTFLLTALLILVLAACGAEEKADGEGKSELKEEYTVVSDTSFVPFEFKEDGEYVGFDIDLINAIADEAGFKINMETTNFDGIIPGLQTGQFDIAIAGISITDERAKKIDYSEPYYQSGLSIGVREENEDIKGIEDLEGKTIATRLGSTSAAYIADNIEGAEASQFEQLDQAYMAVENGSADAVLYDAPNVAYYIKTKGDGLKVVGDLYQAEDYGIAISKGNDELVAAIDDALATLKENGKYDELYEKWFGEKPE